MNTIPTFETKGWAADGILFNNHLIGRGEGEPLRFLFTIQFVKRWFRTHPSFSLTLFYRPWKGAVSGKKLGVRFENIGPAVEGLFDVHDRGDGKSVSLICHDPDVFENILSRLAIPKTVIVTIFGNDIELTRIPLPHDDFFIPHYELFRRSREFKGNN